MEINKAIGVISSNGIKVYPIRKQNKWFIQADIKGEKTTFPKSVDQKEINDAMAKTIIFYANKITKNIK